MIPEQQNPVEKTPNIAEIAQKQRHLHLLDKVKQNTPLTKPEIKELARYEKQKAESIQVTVGKKLTFKQQKFVDCWDGNIKTTAQKAGLTYGYCRKLGTKKHIVDTIRQRQAIELKPEIATRQHRQKFWTETMNDKSIELRDRLKASELLGKSECDFVNKQVNYQTNTLAEFLLNEQGDGTSDGTEE